MLDILKAILEDEPIQFHDKSLLKPPYTDMEQKLLGQMDALEKQLDWNTVDELRSAIHGVVFEARDHIDAAYIRFGAQLMLQLLMDA